MADPVAGLLTLSDTPRERDILEHRVIGIDVANDKRRLDAIQPDFTANDHIPGLLPFPNMLPQPPFIRDLLGYNMAPGDMEIIARVLMASGINSKTALQAATIHTLA